MTYSKMTLLPSSTLTKLAMSSSPGVEPMLNRSCGSPVTCTEMLNVAVNSMVSPGP